jgi:diguanylate cyclase (GGDEF)-like protein/PAS domain S-box-containing protein
MTPTEPSFYRDVLDHISDGVYFVDRDRRILYWNQGAFRLTGYKAEEVVGRCCQDDMLRHVDAAGRNLCLDGCPLTACIADGVSHEAQVFLRHKRGRRIPVWVRVQPMRAADGSVAGAVEIFSDDTTQHAAQRKTLEMERLAFLDHLTQAPNRRYLEMSLQTAFIEYQVHQDPFGVLVADIDRFKAINDDFGHDAGDRALREVATTLTRTLRTTDLVGRWGGDEFMAIVRHVGGETLSSLAERCRALVAQTGLRTNDERLVSILSVSVGGAIVCPGDSPEALIKRADEAMYQDKMTKRDRGKGKGI